MLKFKEHELEELQGFAKLAFDNFVSNGNDPFGIHGPRHWSRVATYAALMCEKHDINPVDGVIFGIFHDCCRMNDGHDPGHGPRAAAWIEGIQTSPIVYTDEFQMIFAAIARHTEMMPGEPVSVFSAICCNADRLDISRCGLEIDDRFLFTSIDGVDRLMFSAQFDGEQDAEFPLFSKLGFRKLMVDYGKAFLRQVRRRTS